MARYELLAAAEDLQELSGRLQRRGARGRQVLREIVDSFGGKSGFVINETLLMPASGAEEARVIYKPSRAFLGLLAALRAADAELVSVGQCLDHSE